LSLLCQCFFLNYSISYCSQVLEETRHYNATADLDGPNSVVMSPDGGTAYVCSTNTDSIVYFNSSHAHSPGVALADQPESSLDILGTVNLLDHHANAKNPTSIAVSPDGLYAYVTARPSNDGVLLHFKRDVSTSDLEYIGSFTNEDLMSDQTESRPLDGPYSVACTEDFVYVVGTSWFSSNYGSLAVFALNTTSGTLAHTQTVYHGDVQSGTTVKMSGAYSVTVYQTNIYVTSDTSAVVSIFEHRGASSEVVYLGATDGNEDMKGPRSLAVAPDGRHVYVACGYSDAIVVLERNTTSGLLNAIGTVAQGSKSNAMQVLTMDFPRAVAVSPSGEKVYVAASKSNAVTSFSRNNVTGALLLLGFRSTAMLDGARHVISSPDGEEVFVASEHSDSLSVFGSRQVCLSCAEGTFQADTGTQECTSCPGGRYQPLTGQSRCEKCPLGTAHDLTGQISLESCQPCQPGEYQDQTGQDSCVVCPTGTFQQYPRQTTAACIDCPGGRFSEQVGSKTVASCSICEAGYSCSLGKKTKCKEGEYCESGTSLPKLCAPGYYCSSPESVELCPSGTYCPSGTVAPSECQPGVTCALPALPELVILPDTLLQRREGELSEFVTYELALSAMPDDDVHVQIRAAEDILLKPACHTYTRNFTLGGAREIQDVTFTRENYNVSQTVEMNIGYDRDAVEGNHHFKVSHVLNSTDPVWLSAFVRSVFVTVIEDTPCVDGAYLIDLPVKDNGLVIRTCQCSEGYYILEEEQDLRFCGSVTQCNGCSEGMMCNKQQQLDEALIEAGYFRASNASTLVVPCPLEGVCVSNGTHGDQLCRNGHSGPLCMTCLVTDAERYVWDDKVCVVCDTSHELTIYLMVAVLGLFCFLVIYCLVRKRKKKGDGGGDGSSGREKKSKLGAALAKMSNGNTEQMLNEMQCKYKILVVFLQIMGKVATSYPIALPAAFLTVFSKVDFFAFLDIGFLPFNCIFNSNFHDVLVMVTLLPFAFTLLVFIVFLVQRRRLQNTDDYDAKVHTLQSSSMRVVILFWYTMFPVVTKTIFQTWAYDYSLQSEPTDGGGGSYLRQDYSIERMDPEHRWYSGYAGLMAFVYCIGFPGISFLALRMHHKVTD
jgi:6-phosphogluconolactonase (cycloisomerase 2 family)